MNPAVLSEATGASGWSAQAVQSGRISWDVYSLLESCYGDRLRRAFHLLEIALVQAVNVIGP